MHRGGRPGPGVVLGVNRIVLLAVALMAAACGGAVPYDPTPQDCAQVFSVRRCLFMADAATAYSDWTRDDVASLEIIPDPPPRTDGILETRGGAKPINVRVTLEDGSTIDTTLCGGVPSGPACRDAEPGPVVVRGIEGYRDTPCPGEPPVGCPSPVPTIAPDAAAAAEPIRRERLEITIDRVGAYEVEVGEGSLPNGILSDIAYTLPEADPLDVTFTDGSLQVVVRSREPDGRPFENVYAHGWRDGVERVEAVIVFDVRRFDPGAVLVVEDILVR